MEISEDINGTYLYYAVSDKGMTLRDFVKPKHDIRGSLHNLLHRNYPIDIILQLIEAYEFMTKNNMLVGQPNINPDCIWIERGMSGEIKAYVLNTLETDILDKYRINNDNDQYWSSDYIREYNDVNYYNMERKHIPKLTRCDSLLSSTDIVYSLALLLYFIIERQDPYPEGRINPIERPYFTQRSNVKYKKYIMYATEPNKINRPLLNEWKKMIQYKDKEPCLIM